MSRPSKEMHHMGPDQSCLMFEVLSKNFICKSRTKWVLNGSCIHAENLDDRTGFGNTSTIQNWESDSFSDGADPGEIQS